MLRRLGADVEALEAVGDGAGLHHLLVAVAAEVVAAVRVGGQHQFVAALRQELFGQVHLVRFHQRAADLTALREAEGVGHRAADQDLVTDAQQVVDHVDLVADLGPAQDRDEGPLGVFEGVGQVLDLLLHQQAHHRGLALGLHGLRHGVHAGLGAVGGAEGVVAVHVAQVREGFNVSVVVALLLAGVEAHVLEHQHLPGFQGPGLGLRVGPGGVAGELHVPAEQLTQLVGGGLQAELVIAFALGAPQVAHHDHRPAAVEHVLDRRERHRHPPVVGDLARVVQRDVEVAAHQHFLAGQVEVGDGLLGHRASGAWGGFGFRFGRNGSRTE